MVRHAVALLTVSAALAMPGLAPARAPAEPPAATPTFAFSGRGWGHGVGMSQWGAYGFALHGWTYDRIVAHYYRGTELGKAPGVRVRVLLAAGKKRLTVSSDGPFRLRDGAGELHELEPGRYAFGPGLRIALEPGTLTQLPGPLLFTGLTTPVRLDGKRYRGSVEIAVDQGKLRAINAVGLEAYLYGVVPDEVPDDWPAETLKAQAVVARSYALAVRKSGPYDLYADVRSQVYGGFDAEAATTTAAVKATAGEVVTYGGKVATTYFFSTSGGRTASVADVWSGTPVPYLVSVPDPYDTASPHHTWGPVTLSTAKLRKELDVAGRLLDLRTTLNSSGRVGALVAIGSEGDSSMQASEARRRLGLRSTWFRIGALGLDPLARPVVYGGTARLAGVARGIAAPTLEQRAAAAAPWEQAGALKPGPDGRFLVAVKPLASTDYRVVGGSVRSAALRVGVAPLLRLAAPADAAALRGTVKPALDGAAVGVQRLEGTVWRTVGSATIDAQGAFEARLELVPGTYRARIAPGRGFAEGLSPELAVGPR
jgi:stage II sporulation protein D